MPPSFLRPLLPASLALCALLALSPPAAVATGSGGTLAGAPGDQAATSDRFVQPGDVGGVSADSSSPPETTSPVGGTAPTGPLVPADVPFGALIASTARSHTLPVSLFTALVWQESGFRARARSKAGARGLTQLMPGTARELGVRRIYDPAENLHGGASYLKAQLARFGSVRLALAAYNAGPNAVAKFRGVPPYRETRRYVESILRMDARLRALGVR